MYVLNEYLRDKFELIEEKGIPGILGHEDSEDADWVFVFSKDDYDNMYEMSVLYKYHFGGKWINFGDYFFNETYKKEEYLEPYLCLSYWPNRWMSVSEIPGDAWNRFKRKPEAIIKEHITIQDFIKYAKIPENKLRRI